MTAFLMSIAIEPGSRKTSSSLDEHSPWNCNAASQRVPPQHVILQAGPAIGIETNYGRYENHSQEWLRLIVPKLSKDSAQITSGLPTTQELIGYKGISRDRCPMPAQILARPATTAAALSHASKSPRPESGYGLRNSPITSANDGLAMML